MESCYESENQKSLLLAHSVTQAAALILCHGQNSIYAPVQKPENEKW